MYLVEKTLNQIYSEGTSFFLNPNDLENVCNHLKKNTYSIFLPNPYCEKKIIYLKNEPDVILLEIISGIPLRHQDILGTLYSLGISDNLFGDIIIYQDHYYFYTFRKMHFYFETELTKIKNTSVQLIERDLHILDNYKPLFEEKTIIVSSLRMDNVLAKVIETNRDKVKELIKDKRVYLNYNLLQNNEKQIHINDTFSVRKYGKYRLKEIIGNTKKNNLILIIQKYVDN